MWFCVSYYRGETPFNDGCSYNGAHPIRKLNPSASINKVENLFRMKFSCPPWRNQKGICLESLNKGASSARWRNDKGTSPIMFFF